MGYGNFYQDLLLSPKTKHYKNFDTFVPTMWLYRHHIRDCSDRREHVIVHDTLCLQGGASGLLQDHCSTVSEAGSRE